MSEDQLRDPAMRQMIVWSIWADRGEYMSQRAGELIYLLVLLFRTEGRRNQV